MTLNLIKPPLCGFESIDENQFCKIWAIRTILRIIRIILSRLVIFMQGQSLVLGSFNILRLRVSSFTSENANSTLIYGKFAFFKKLYSTIYPFNRVKPSGVQHLLVENFPYQQFFPNLAKVFFPHRFDQWRSYNNAFGSSKFKL